MMSPGLAPATVESEAVPLVGRGATMVHTALPHCAWKRWVRLRTITSPQSRPSIVRPKVGMTQVLLSPPHSPQASTSALPLKSPLQSTQVVLSPRHTPHSSYCEQELRTPSQP